MKLSEIKNKLKSLDTVSFQLPNGEIVPQHFHITEIGKITKHFIDCGGTERKENIINFQLWSANDYQHRLQPKKLLHIIELSENVLNIDDNLQVEVEYQGKSIEKYGIDFDGKNFLLTIKQTDCLDKEKCGITTEKPKVKLSEIGNNSCCTPGGDCC